MPVHVGVKYLLFLIIDNLIDNNDSIISVPLFDK